MMKKFSENEKKSLIKVLKQRFEENRHRHKGTNWNDVEVRLINQPDKLWSLNEMEISGGEPDVIGFDKDEKAFIFCDCSAESPTGRRSLCYDHQALESRKKHKPEDSAVNMASKMKIEILNEEQYGYLQSLESFDTKTSSWLKTPDKIRELGGAIFGDFRFGRVFCYHNGADSYYAARGFRGLVKV